MSEAFSSICSLNPLTSEVIKFRMISKVRFEKAKVMENRRKYPILILKQEPGFRVLLTSHAGRRVHQRRPELWDAARRRLAEPLKLELAERGCGLKALSVRGECKLIVDGLRVVYDMSNTAARIVTVMTQDEASRTQNDRGGFMIAEDC
ncbi:MAG: hypothetical protein HC853_10745 [Anaerolineae bacterium]|nr:hypothetical protein [Anaerolineae bacterium]